MAALASTAVTTLRDAYIGRNGEVVTRTLKLVLTGQGGSTNTIGASALGFSKLHECSSLNDKTNGKLMLAAVDPVANIINLSLVAADTYADVTTTAGYITVTGNPAIAR
jgi:hypothetical protein